MVRVDEGMQYTAKDLHTELRWEDCCARFRFLTLTRWKTLKCALELFLSWRGLYTRTGITVALANRVSSIGYARTSDVSVWNGLRKSIGLLGSSHKYRCLSDSEHSTWYGIARGIQMLSQECARAPEPRPFERKSDNSSQDHEIRVKRTKIWTQHNLDQVAVTWGQIRN